MPLHETEAMRTAFTALAGLDRDTETSVMVWLMQRLREHRRGQEAAAYKGPTPTEWQFHYPDDDESGTYDSRDEGIMECDARALEIVEITAHAAVHQEFLVVVPTGDPDIGDEHEFFPTRADAEEFVKLMRADARLEEGNL